MEKTKNKSLIQIALVLVVLVLGTILVGCAVDSNSIDDYLTYENYLKIENGMTYSEVVDILGGYEGTLDTSAGSEGYYLEYYSWTSEYGLEIITIGFENGKVMAKSQIGLH